MLLILIAAACVLVASLGLISLGLMICRAAALSDESHRLAVADWLAAMRREHAGESRPAERRDGRFRATG